MIPWLKWFQELSIKIASTDATVKVIPFCKIFSQNSKLKIIYFLTVKYIQYYMTSIVYKLNIK